MDDESTSPLKQRDARTVAAASRGATDVHGTVQKALFLMQSASATSTGMKRKQAKGWHQKPSKEHGDELALVQVNPKPTQDATEATEDSIEVEGAVGDVAKKQKKEIVASSSGSAEVVRQPRRAP